MKVGQGLVIHTFSKVRDVHVLLDIRSDNTPGSCGLQYKLVEVPGTLRNKGAGSHFLSLKGKESTHSLYILTFVQRIQLGRCHILLCLGRISVVHCLQYLEAMLSPKQLGVCSQE